jgi:hypothetical protein
MNYLLVFLRPLATAIFAAISAYQKKFHRLPQWYFFALEQIALLSAYELLVTKQTAAGLEILLIKRPDNDPVWPNLWHFPGTILRLYDSEPKIFARLAVELGMESLPAKPKFVTTVIQDNGRGRHLHVFWRLEVAAETQFSTGQFFSIDQLPTDLIAYQREQLAQVLDKAKSF